MNNITIYKKLGFVNLEAVELLEELRFVPKLEMTNEEKKEVFSIQEDGASVWMDNKSGNGIYNEYKDGSWVKSKYKYGKMVEQFFSIGNYWHMDDELRKIGYFYGKYYVDDVEHKLKNPEKSPKRVKFEDLEII